MKIEVNNSPTLMEASQGSLASMKQLEEKYHHSMTTERLNRNTVVSCKNKAKIDEYKKYFNLK